MKGSLDNTSAAWNNHSSDALLFAVLFIRRPDFRFFVLSNFRDSTGLDSQEYHESPKGRKSEILQLAEMSQRGRGEVECPLFAAYLLCSEEQPIVSQRFLPENRSV